MNPILPILYAKDQLECLNKNFMDLQEKIVINLKLYNLKMIMNKIVLKKKFSITNFLFFKLVKVLENMKLSIIKKEN